jgi:gliding motility-associated-like protein
MNTLLKALCVLTAVCCSFSSRSQYILNGSATQDNCNCYTLTQQQPFQSGSVWNSTKINLTLPFDFIFNVNLGCKDADGADGIVFILQPISTSVGTAGSGMGFQGIVPSVGIALDTWQNTEVNDPPFDHLSIQINGNINHANDIAPVMQAQPTNPNIEDCQWHTFRIIWDPAAQLLKTYFDGYFIQQANIDLVTTVFNNDPMVYWGFSAATGGSNNLQQFCTALNPNFNASVTGNATCDGNPITFTNTSQSFAPIASFFWDFGDGTTSTLANPPPHVYAAPGNYIVKLAIKGLDGCSSDTLKKTFVIGDYPTADFVVYDTCAGNPPRVIDRSQVIFGIVSEWQWSVDGNVMSTSQQPNLTGLANGIHTLTLVVKSNNGCTSAPLSKQFNIQRRPVFEVEAANTCLNVPVAFTARQLDNAYVISEWNWTFGDGQTSTEQNPFHTYTSQGNYNVSVTAIGDNGCSTTLNSLQVMIHPAIANAGEDKIVIQNEPFQLNGSGGVTYNWSPPLGLSDATIANPTGILQDDIKYTLSITTAEGCTDDDEINIVVFKGSAIYVPTGFTPNNDGLNDKLIPLYGGIRSLDYFSVYNRWGQLLFTTKDLVQGWDGTLKGVMQATGVYVWMVKATDYAGKVYQLKGHTTIVR